MKQIKKNVQSTRYDLQLTKKIQISNSKYGTFGLKLMTWSFFPFFFLLSFSFSRGIWNWGLGTCSAQNIAINTTGAAANASAILDVNASNKGMLIPQIGLLSSIDGTTINLPATSLLVYNNGTGGFNPKGYYYNSGTPVLPVWVNLVTPATASSGSGDWTLVAVANSTVAGTGDFWSGFIMASNKEYLVVAVGNTIEITLATSDAVALFGPISTYNVSLSATLEQVMIFANTIGCNSTGAARFVRISGKKTNASITTAYDITPTSTEPCSGAGVKFRVKGTGEIGCNEGDPSNDVGIYIFER